MLSCSKYSSQMHPDVSQHHTAKEIIELVDDAATLVEEKGIAAFDDFREQDSKWRYDNIYLYVFDSDGLNLFHPREDLEGNNLMHLKDEENFELVKGLIEIGKTNKEGWVSFMWVAPNDTETSRKLAYIKEAQLDGEIIFIGAGFHPKDH